MNECYSGENVGLLLRGVQRKDIFRGQVIAKPNTVKLFRNIEASLYILTENEGGRKKPFPSGYRPQIYLRTADVAVEIILPDNVKMGMPGDNVNVKIKLSNPLPLDKGQRFAIREGGKTVAAGVISAVFPDQDGDDVLGFNNRNAIKAKEAKEKKDEQKAA